MANPFDLAEAELAKPAPNPFDVAEQELSTVGQVEGAWNALRRGTVSALAIPDVLQAAGTANIGKPSIRQERKAYVSAMSDPQYQQKLMEAGDDPQKLRQVESTRGPSAKLDQIMTPARALQRANAEEVANVQQKLAAIPKSEAQQRLASAQNSGEKWSAWLKDPVELTTSIVLESLPPSVAGTILGAPLGPAGVAAGAGAASALQTFSAEFLGTAAQQGVDVSNPDQLEAFLNNQPAFRAAFDTAMTKAGIVGGVDALTAGQAGRFIEPALKQGLKQRVIATGKEIALQAGGGAAGEAAGQVVTGQKLDPFDIAMEALAEVGTAPAEIATNLRGSSTTENGSNLSPTPAVVQPPTQPAPTDSTNPFDVAEAQQVQVQRELASLPGAEQDLVDAPITSPQSQPEQATTDSNSRPAAAGAPPVAPDASPDQQARVRAELQALPGAEQDLANEEGGMKNEEVTTQDQRPETQDQTPATKADLIALAEFIEKGGPNPFARLNKDVQAGVNDPTGDTSNSGLQLNKPSGQPDATAKPPQTITGSNVQTGTEMPVSPQPAGGAIKPVTTTETAKAEEESFPADWTAAEIKAARATPETHTADMLADVGQYLDGVKASLPFISEALVTYTRRAANDPEMRPGLTRIFEAVATAAKKQGVSVEQLKRRLSQQMTKVYGADAKEMSEFYFGNTKPSQNVSSQVQSTLLTKEAGTVQPAPNAPQVTLPRSTGGPRADIIQQEPTATATESAPTATKADAVEAWLNRAIDATELKQGELLEGVTGAPVWLTKAAANGVLRVVRAAYQATKNVAQSIQAGLAWLQDQKLAGFDEQEARGWLDKLANDERAAGTNVSEFARLQDEITVAERELMTAIRTHMTPPAGVRKAEALQAKNDAAAKLNRLLVQQLKLMTSANVDVARSPEQTAEMIGQTVDLLNQLGDEISTFNARSQEVPADLTKLRQDLQTRLNLLKGWTDDQTDLEARGIPPVKQPDSARARFAEIESATDPERNTWGEWLEKLKTGLRYLTSPIPELPLTGPRARTSALFRRGYRLFSVENNRVKTEAADKINHVLEPLTKLGRAPQDNAALRQYFQLGSALQRAKMDEAKSKTIRERMAAVEKRLERDPYNLFRRLVLYRDLWWRGTYLKNEEGKPITLPMGLTVDEVSGQLQKLTKAIAQHKDGLAITEALRRHYALTDDLQKSILAHGEIIPESLRNPLFFPHHVLEFWSGKIDRVRPTTDEDFRKYLITPQGSGKLHQSDYLKAMYLHTASVLSHNARVDLVQKYWQPYDLSEQLKAQHGADWNKPWNLPPGYKLFTPFKKLSLRMDYILSREVLADKLGVLFNDGDLRERMGEAGKVIKINPEDLHAALVAGEKIQWALPEEIAEALNGIAKREAAEANPGLLHTALTPFRKLQTFWKVGKLFLPTNWIRYEFGNVSTDAVDKVLAADPQTSKYLARAAKEVWNSDKGEQTPEFKAAQREGVFDTVTAGEAGDLMKLPAFKEFLTPGEKRLGAVKHVLGGPARGSKFREATFRYAKFLADVERLRAGKEPVYAGAFHGDIEALGDDVDGQRRMLEGDELIYAKAAEISLKTYGDYASISEAGKWIRQYAIPFWSWQDVNFRYHANQLRNIADGLMGKTGDVGTARKAALRYAGIRVVTTLAAIGIAKELWNQFGGPALGMWDDDDDLESKLSAQDRRRGHLLMGKDDKGQAIVIYTPSAFSDVAEWVGGQNMKRLFMEWARGQITLGQWVSDYAKQMPGDVGNKLAQSIGPNWKTPYEFISGKATFPDVFDQRSIAKSERWWRLVGNMTDDRIVNTLRGSFDKDFYSQPASEQLQQIILQMRRRDFEQWSYFEAREDASDWKEAKTGKNSEFGSYNAPEAQALRNFRKAIYRGDVVNAERFYARLLEFGYTADRLDDSIRNQAPLADLNETEREDYIKTLTPKQRQELDLANKYYNRLQALDGRERELFPIKGNNPEPNPELLKRIVEEQNR